MCIIWEFFWMRKTFEHNYINKKQGVITYWGHKQARMSKGVSLELSVLIVSYFSYISFLNSSNILFSSKRDSYFFSNIFLNGHGFSFSTGRRNAKVTKSYTHWQWCVKISFWVFLCLTQMRAKNNGSKWLMLISQGRNFGSNRRGRGDSCYTKSRLFWGQRKEKKSWWWWHFLTS